MSPRGKKRTTMAKLSRESRLLERRVEKEARKQARRREATSRPVDERWQTAEDPGDPGDSTRDPAAEAEHPTRH